LNTQDDDDTISISNSHFVKLALLFTVKISGFFNLSIKLSPVHAFYYDAIKYKVFIMTHWFISLDCVTDLLNTYFSMEANTLYTYPGES
jgi:hypothetical protein